MTRPAPPAAAASTGTRTRPIGPRAGCTTGWPRTPASSSTARPYERRRDGARLSARRGLELAAGDPVDVGVAVLVHVADREYGRHRGLGHHPDVAGDGLVEDVLDGERDAALAGVDAAEQADGAVAEQD